MVRGEKQVVAYSNFNTVFTTDEKH